MGGTPLLRDRRRTPKACSLFYFPWSERFRRNARFRHRGSPPIPSPLGHVSPLPPIDPSGEANQSQANREGVMTWLAILRDADVLTFLGADRAFVRRRRLCVHASSEPRRLKKICVDIGFAFSAVAHGHPVGSTSLNPSLLWATPTSGCEPVPAPPSPPPHLAPNTCSTGNTPRPPNDTPHDQTPGRLTPPTEPTAQHTAMPLPATCAPPRTHTAPPRPEIRAATSTPDDTPPKASPPQHHTPAPPQATERNEAMTTQLRTNKLTTTPPKVTEPPRRGGGVRVNHPVSASDGSASLNLSRVPRAIFWGLW